MFQLAVRQNGRLCHDLLIDRVSTAEPTLLPCLFCRAAVAFASRCTFRKGLPPLSRFAVGPISMRFAISARRPLRESCLANWPALALGNRNLRSVFSFGKLGWSVKELGAGCVSSESLSFLSSVVPPCGPGGSMATGTLAADAMLSLASG